MIRLICSCDALASPTPGIPLGDQPGQEFDQRDTIKAEEAHAWAQVTRGQVPTIRAILAAEFRLFCAEVCAPNTHSLS